MKSGISFAKDNDKHCTIRSYTVNELFCAMFESSHGDRIPFIETIVFVMCDNFDYEHVVSCLATIKAKNVLTHF